MKSRLVKSFFTAGLLVIFSGICPYVLSQTAGGPVNLLYNYPADKAIKYLTNSTMAQIMDIQGQTMQTDVSSALGCSVKSVGKQDNNLKLEILIDTLGQTTNSPMGYAGGAIQEVKGKTFNIVVTPEGKTVDISEAASLTFNVEGSGESNFAQNISEFFPVLPSKPVTVGEVWNLLDSISTKSTTITSKSVDNTVNKLEGIETVNGMECAKISTTHSGNMTMSIQAQGMDIYLAGPFTGTSECLFAIKEGYFIKQTSSTKMTGNLEIASQGMTLPIVIDSKAVNEIRK
jgi:hypothetical protein